MFASGRSAFRRFSRVQGSKFLPIQPGNRPLTTVHSFSCYAAQNFHIINRGSPVLVELRLENYAVIDNAAVEFACGLNLLTGETGAGKSILIDALALLLGEKASSDVIRTGAERAVVSAVFECEGAAGEAIEKTLEHNGLDESQDGSLIIRRE